MGLISNEMLDITHLVGPGIYRIDSINTGFSLFVETSGVYDDVQEFVYKLHAGICENENLLKDFQTFGIYNFKFLAIAVGPEFNDIEKRKSRLEEEKSNWPPELLY